MAILFYWLRYPNSWLQKQTAHESDKLNGMLFEYIKDYIEIRVLVK